MLGRKRIMRAVVTKETHVDVDHVAWMHGIEPNAAAGKTRFLHLMDARIGRARNRLATTRAGLHVDRFVGRLILLF